MHTYAPAPAARPPAPPTRPPPRSIKKQWGRHIVAAIQQAEGFAARVHAGAAAVDDFQLDQAPILALGQGQVGGPAGGLRGAWIRAGGRCSDGAGWHGDKAAAADPAQGSVGALVGGT